jgi:hypothetical protein
VPRRTTRLALGAITSLLVLTGVAGCGEDVPTKADFIDRVREITNPPLDRVVAACAYDRIGKNTHLVEVAVQSGKIPSKDQKQLSEILAKCVVDTATTTTAKGDG